MGGGGGCSINMEEDKLSDIAIGTKRNFKGNYTTIPYHLKRYLNRGQKVFVLNLYRKRERDFSDVISQMN